jgi:hypothetical protein
MLGICSIYFQADVGVGTRQMATVKDFREFADECMRWAVQAHTEDHRKAFLQMASAWTQAALRLEGVLIPYRRSAFDPPQWAKGQRTLGAAARRLFIYVRVCHLLGDGW